MTSPKLSVVMPAYNAEDTVADAVRSILSDEFEGLELIIINDGSNDRTGEILRNFKDPRIQLIEHENKGIAAALNEGITISKSGLIARMDADDINLPGRFSQQYTHMLTNPHIGILGGQAQIIDEAGKIIGRAIKPISFDRIKKYSEFACPVLHPTYCARKEIYQLLDGYRDIPVEDYDFLLRAIEQNVIVENLPIELIKYRVRNTGLSYSNPYRTAKATRIVQKLHRLRQSNRKEAPLLNVLKNLSHAPHNRFLILHKWRAALLERRIRGRKVRNTLISVAVIAVSALHPSLLLSSYLTYRATREA